MPRNSPVTGVSGSVRIQRLSGVSLAAAEAHGKRQDHAGKARSIRDVPPLTTSGLDLRDLHAQHIEGAARRKGAPDGLHMVLQFPTKLIDVEDIEDIEWMLEEARNFAVSIFGDDAIFADRVDRDEKSEHVVDLFVAPKYEKVTKRGSKLAVSTSKHLKELAAKRGKAPTLRGQGQALQDAWFEHLRDKMDLDVKRGAKKRLPGDDWETPEQLELSRLAEEVEKARQEAAESLTEAAEAHREAQRAEWALKPYSEAVRGLEDANERRAKAKLEAERQEGVLRNVNHQLKCAKEALAEHGAGDRLARELRGLRKEIEEAEKTLKGLSGGAAQARNASEHWEKQVAKARTQYDKTTDAAISDKRIIIKEAESKAEKILETAVKGVNAWQTGFTNLKTSIRDVAPQLYDKIFDRWEALTPDAKKRAAPKQSPDGPDGPSGPS